jgi:hypothetical protein
VSFIPRGNARSPRFAVAATALVFIIAELASLKIAADLFARFHAGWTFFLPADLQCFVTHAAFALGRFRVMPPGIEPFMYPPPFLLLAAPFSFMPAGMAFALWSCLGGALFCLAGLQLPMRPALAISAVLLPPAIYCFILGQSGLIPSALLILSLFWLPQKPLRAGVIAGMLVLKPQTALLLPVCFMAARQYRAIMAAIASAAIICIVTVLCFGLQPWLDFIRISLPEARQVLNAPWHQNYQNLMVSPFILLRSLHCSLGTAYAVQLAITLLACGLAWRLWRATGRGHEIILLTACLAAVSTPYAYVYDLPCIGLLLLACWPRQGWQLLAGLSFILGTGLYVLIADHFLPIGASLTAGLALAFWPRRESFPRSRSGPSHSGFQT